VTEENETDMDGCRSGTFYGKIPALALRNAWKSRQKLQLKHTTFGTGIEAKTFLVPIIWPRKFNHLCKFRVDNIQC
jgi:hypothetical protein